MPRNIKITSPIDGRAVGTVPRDGKLEVGRAYQELVKSQPGWAEQPLANRLRQVKKMAAALRNNRRELTGLLVREIGKTPAEAESEVLRTADLVDGTIKEAGRQKPERIKDPRRRGRVQTVERVPLGVVLAISPFNYPLNLSVSKIAPALAAGNTVLWKPSTQGAVTAWRFASLLAGSGFPRGVLGVVTGTGEDIGDALIDDPRVAMVALTGSTAVGHRVAKKSGMIPLLLELGGNDPAIVLEDANLDLAAEHIVGGAFKYSGQRCTAVKRAYVVNAAADRLVAKLIEQTMKRFGSAGDPREHPVGPVINDESARRQRALIADAKRRGAKVVVGGRVKSRFVEATILDQVPQSARIVREEQFGPVLPVVRVRSDVEALRLANDTEYGLQASVFSRDIAKAKKLADQIEAGGVHLNGPDQRGPDNFLFTGHRASGIGAQGIRFALGAMSKPKAYITNR